MEDKTTYKTPKDILIRMQVVHLGKILFNLQFLAISIMIASVLSFIVPAIYYMLLIVVSFFTLFTIYAWYPEFSSFWSAGEQMTKITSILLQSWKYTVPIVVFLSIASIICLCADRNQKHTTRIVTSAIFAVLSVIIIILKFINGGGI